MAAAPQEYVSLYIINENPIIYDLQGKKRTFYGNLLRCVRQQSFLQNVGWSWMTKIKWNSVGRGDLWV
jgi:hypothetical protein